MKYYPRIEGGEIIFNMSACRDSPHEISRTLEPLVLEGVLKQEAEHLKFVFNDLNFFFSEPTSTLALKVNEKVILRPLQLKRFTVYDDITSTIRKMQRELLEYRQKLQPTSSQT